MSHNSFAPDEYNYCPKLQVTPLKFPKKSVDIFESNELRQYFPANTGTMGFNDAM
jgi:hypothetical protein